MNLWLVSSFTDSTSLQLVGTVSATSRAIIQSESAGRVTQVPVALGMNVRAGQIIAQLENALEYASVLQAEGLYEGAVAASQVGDISVVEAKNTQLSAQNNALNTYRNSYTTVSNAVYNTLDTFYGNPQFSTPGVRLSVNSETTEYLNNERVAFTEILKNWQQKSVTLTYTDNVASALREATGYTQRVLYIVDTFIGVIETEDTGATLNGVSLSSYAVTLNTLRGTLNNTLSSLESAGTALVSAEEILKKAELGGTNSDVSAANAQVKQALGTLRAAQANYNKTILRSPIAGLVNSIDIQKGDFVSGMQQVAVVANNDALEVTTFVGQSDRERISVNQEVRIENSIVGTIGTIAPAVDVSTGKVEVIINSTSDALVNGDTVTITLQNESNSQENTFIQVPLTAIKFTTNAGSVFTVDQGQLVSRVVEIGEVRDLYIEVVSGLTSDMVIVIDSRGLSEGQKVSVISN
jgi:RND family efflux transporter MFP subunit